MAREVSHLELFILFAIALAIGVGLSLLAAPAYEACAVAHIEEAP